MAHQEGEKVSVCVCVEEKGAFLDMTKIIFLKRKHHKKEKRREFPCLIVLLYFYL